MRVGDLDIAPLSDGTLAIEQDFYVGLDFTRHPELLGSDGRSHIPVGCFLVRTGDLLVLVDAGLGEIDHEGVDCGLLPDALRAAGASPGDIDIVVCTHLHRDHIGWLVVDGEPYFPNASIRYGHADWDHFAAEGAVEIPQIMDVLADAGRLEPLDGDLVPVAPGVTARHTPGHTPGHYGLVVASGEDRAYVLGDAVEHPLQIAEPDFHALSDVDPALAATTRAVLLSELEDSGHLMTAAHFPDLRFGRVVTAQGRRFVPVG